MRRSLVIAALLLASCYRERTPAEVVAIQSCLLAVEADHNARAEVECPDSWDECANRKAILESLKKAQEECYDR